MRVAIVGMGAIGHVLAEALGGRVDLVRIDRSTAPPHEGEAPVEVALIATKTPGTAWAADQAARILAPDGVAITLQNGLGNYEKLVERLGLERAGAGVIIVGAALQPDGSLWTTGPARIEMGRGRRVDELAAALTAGGMTVEVRDDPWPAVWRKVVANCAINPLTALFSRTNGELLSYPAAPAIADGLAREAARAANASGIAIDENEAVELWRTVARVTAENRNSMRADVEAGRETEVEAINGEVARRARAAGASAPLNEAMRILIPALSP